jgi:hypothetical protein
MERSESEGSASDQPLPRSLPEHLRSSYLTRHTFTTRERMIVSHVGSIAQPQRGRFALIFHNAAPPLSILATTSIPNPQPQPRVSRRAKKPLNPIHTRHVHNSHTTLSLPIAPVTMLACISQLPFLNPLPRPESPPPCPGL